MLIIQLIVVFDSDRDAAHHISSLDACMNCKHKLMTQAMRNKREFGKPCLFMIEMIDLRQLMLN